MVDSTIIDLIGIVGPIALFVFLLLLIFLWLEFPRKIRKKQQISAILTQLFYFSGFAFVGSNVITYLSNIRVISNSAHNLILALEGTGLLLSFCGLCIVIFYAIKRKNDLTKIFKELPSSTLLDLKVGYIVVLTIVSLGGLAFQRPVQFAWAFISLAFIYIRFSVDEYMKERNPQPPRASRLARATNQASSE